METSWEAVDYTLFAFIVLFLLVWSYCLIKLYTWYLAFKSRWTKTRLVFPGFTSRKQLPVSRSTLETELILTEAQLQAFNNQARAQSQQIQQQLTEGRRLLSRTVATQSQTTYTRKSANPRQVPLAEDRQGVWAYNIKIG